jgi:RimJ/RimL family protein N-acetyltransferase
VAWILDWHHASQRVALKLGMTDRGIRTDPHDHVVRRAYADRLFNPG